MCLNGNDLFATDFDDIYVFYVYKDMRYVLARLRIQAQTGLLLLERKE